MNTEERARYDADRAERLKQAKAEQDAKKAEQKAQDAQSKSLREFKPISLSEFLGMTFAKRELILAPWLPAKSIAELYAWRGVGKTYVGLAIALAVATGGTFGRWSAPKPRKVLYVDGEMPREELQDRLWELVNGAGLDLDHDEIKKLSDKLEILTFDMLPPDVPVPNLSTPEGQAFIEAHLDGVELVIFDNLSSLFRSGEENAAEDWQSAQDWFLSLRRRGISTIFFQHSGKKGGQRGTSKHEDVTNAVIALKHPDDYKIEQGLRAEVHFEKARSISGDGVRPFEVQLVVEPEHTIDVPGAGRRTIGRAAKWTICEVGEREIQAFVAALDKLKKELGHDPTDKDEPWKKLSMSRATYYRRLQEARARKWLSEEGETPANDPGKRAAA
jgi:putative DNA primase/helicase